MGGITHPISQEVGEREGQKIKKKKKKTPHWEGTKRSHIAKEETNQYSYTKALEKKRGRGGRRGAAPGRPIAMSGSFAELYPYLIDDYCQGKKKTREEGGGPLSKALEEKSRGERGRFTKKWTGNKQFRTRSLQDLQSQEKKWCGRGHERW